ncbi:carboxypeptidase M32 [Candidatus Tisiphia endosymbiont of Myopa tessellatipennis]|uniref:carboxypeptidase M32 n=1 Tax=Candidatus Tisiphia endosymbiont of Myopa tessellatipennis TaxID=3066257 RepID=UPI00313DDE8D
MKHYTLLEQELEQIFQINNVINILYWDIAVNIPHGSIDSRTNEIALLSSIAHSRLQSKKLAELIESVSENVNTLDVWQLANLRETKRRITESTCIDDDLWKMYVTASAKCELIWRDARKNNDYLSLKPYLQTVLDCVQKMAKSKANALNCSVYDALLDTYDPERTLDEVKVVFNNLKKTIPKLISQIVEKQSKENVLPITNSISEAQQKLIAKRLMEIMGFNLTKGRLDESTHPFCRGTPDDVRLTNRYNEHNFISGIMGIMHETGHGLYEQGLPSKYKNQPVGKAKGMAVHESQSLFMEMQVGRSEEFCQYLSKLLKDEFGFKGLEYSAENLYKLMTRVKLGFIRVEADEVTYPMHVIVRFELERLLISGDLSLDDLPHCWNNKMQEYLGITPQNDKDGCLQDIHWPMGSFGYFPSYTNGAIIASMVMKKAQEVNHNIKKEITRGEFNGVNQFLDNNIRSYGSLKNTSELIKDATGEDRIQSEIFLKYLQQKYL